MINRQSSHPRAQLTTVFIPRPHETRTLHLPLDGKSQTKEYRWRDGEGAAHSGVGVLVVLRERRKEGSVVEGNLDVKATPLSCLAASQS